MEEKITYENLYDIIAALDERSCETENEIRILKERVANDIKAIKDLDEDKKFSEGILKSYVDSIINDLSIIERDMLSIEGKLEKSMKQIKLNSSKIDYIQLLQKRLFNKIIFGSIGVILTVFIIHVLFF